MDPTKERIRRFTRAGFRKIGICKYCGIEDDTGWHHIDYRYPPTRHSVVELCITCHKKIEELKRNCL